MGDSAISWIAGDDALASMSAIEYACEGDDGPRWFQRQPGRFRAWRDGRWRDWSGCGDPIPAFSTAPCRLVPIAEADAEPSTRGPL